MQEVMKASVSCCAAPHCPAFLYIGGATQDCSLRGFLQTSHAVWRMQICRGVHAACSLYASRPAGAKLV